VFDPILMNGIHMVLTHGVVTDIVSWSLIIRQCPRRSSNRPCTEWGWQGCETKHDLSCQ